MRVLKTVLSVLKKVFIILFFIFSTFLMLFECVVVLLSGGDVSGVTAFVILLGFITSIVVGIVFVCRLRGKKQRLKVYFLKLYIFAFFIVGVNFLLLVFLGLCPLEHITPIILGILHFIRRTTIVIYFDLLFVLTASLLTLSAVRISEYIQSHKG